MSKIKVTCDRCGRIFEKDPESSHDRIRKIIDSSVHVRHGDARVNRTYYLCMECSAAFTKWINTPPKRKEKKDD